MEIRNILTAKHSASGYNEKAGGKPIPVCRLIKNYSKPNCDRYLMLARVQEMKLLSRLS